MLTTLFCDKKKIKIVLKIKNECVGNLTDSLYRKSSIKPPSQISPPSLISPPPPHFQRRKVNKPPLSIKSSIKAPSQISPPLISPPFFRGGKLISPPPLSIKPPPQSLFFTKQLTTINVGWSVMVYSGCKFILFWSSAAWPPTSCAELSQLCALLLCGELSPFSYSIIVS